MERVKCTLIHLKYIKKIMMMIIIIVRLTVYGAFRGSNYVIYVFASLLKRSFLSKKRISSSFKS